MKKLVMLGFVCSLTVLFMISSAFAEPYKDKAFPEQQVIKNFCSSYASSQYTRLKACTYIGKVVRNEGYTVYFTVDMVGENLGVQNAHIWRLDSGIWLMQQGADKAIIIMK